MLAASVVIGAGTPRSLPRLEPVRLLVLTGAVFRPAHVHAQLLFPGSLIIAFKSVVKH